MNIVHREDQQQREHVLLSPDAAFSDETEGRAQSAQPDFLRTEYQRDRDKIPTPVAQNAGVPCRRGRPFPHAAHAHA